MNTEACDIYEDVPLSELRKRLTPVPSYSTMRRWVTVGAKSRTGKTVHLQAIRMPGGDGSSVVRYHEFLEQLQD